jgi:hypothetical protein
MNRYDFTQPGGFPLDQGVLNFLQECIKTASVAAALAGPLSILSGCAVIGNYMNEGYVFINGEILPFTAGNIADKIVIEEIATPVVFQEGTAKVVKFVRSARFGDDGTDNFKYSLFKRNTMEGVISRIERVERLTSRVAVCEGLLAPFATNNATMLFWRKLSNVPLPAGWQEVVDWQGRLPMGHTPLYPGRNVGDILGKEGHVMTLGNLIDHDHTYDKPTAEATFDAGGATRFGKQPVSGRTGKAGSVNPDAIPTIPPVRMIMYIEPIPNFYQINP